ncbi:MAG: RNA polymerase sigma factor [Planctomycetota bacterium]|jgi:RNA polymerase sigma-70 factor (ECF subfamily)
MRAPKPGPQQSSSASPIASTSDEALAARLIAGDQRAFDSIVMRWRDRIVDLAHLLTGDPNAADDVGQEVFLRLLRRPDAYDPGRPFKAWIYTVTRNLCHDRFRRESTRSRYQNTASREMEFGPRPTLAPPEAAAANEAEQRLRECIAELPAKFRDAFVLCAVRGMSYAEAAETCGCPAKTVSTRLARARKRLGERMREWL